MRFHEVPQSVCTPTARYFLRHKNFTTFGGVFIKTTTTTTTTTTMMMMMMMSLVSSWVFLKLYFPPGKEMGTGVPLG